MCKNILVPAFNESSWFETCYKKKRSILSDTAFLKCEEEIGGNTHSSALDIKLCKEQIRDKLNIVNEELGILINAGFDKYQIRMQIAKIFHLYLEIAIMTNIDSQDIHRVIERLYSIKPVPLDSFAIIPHMLRAQSYSLKCLEDGAKINTYSELRDMLMEFTSSFLEAVYLLIDLCCSFQIYQKDLFKLFYLLL